MNYLLQVLASAILALGSVQSSPTTKMEQHMVVSKMRMSDLEGSASGYAYDQRQGVPVSFVQYTTHTGGAGADVGLPYDVSSGYPTYTSYNTYPVQTYGDYGDYELPVLPQQYRPPLAPYYPVQPIQPAIQQHLEPPHIPAPIIHPPVNPIQHFEEPAPLHHHHHHHHGDDESFEEGGGAEHHSEDNSAHGERGEKGYGGHHDYDQGENENHEADHREGEYKEEAGHEGGHEQSDSKYDAHDHGESNQEGSNYGNKAYQKKGHRTSGFHNVYRKDEYKKDTDFYDEDHDGGHYEKYGAFDAHHKDEAAGYEKGGKHDSGYELAKHGNNGQFDKGHQHSSHKGHKGAEGEDSYREEHADYANKAGRHHASQHGFKQGHGYR